MIIANRTHGVADKNYIQDPCVGARINGDAIRMALQLSLTKGVGLFQVHVHGHKGIPRPSRTDLDESNKFVPDFFNVTPTMPHGTLILSEDSAFGLCWAGKQLEPKIIDRIEFVGRPSEYSGRPCMTDQLSRQSFLGDDSDRIFAVSKVGIIGFSGGGSHVGQQLAHVGVLNYVVIDPKNMAQKHLHRLVGAAADDVEKGTPKAKIAERLIKGIRPGANVKAIIGTWQKNQLWLRDRTAIIGCVDSYNEREQLERFCRRFLIQYIDVGITYSSAMAHTILLARRC